ncbi:hypothetical protein [Helcococcus kunzii]|uniref:hypothetical protein n=1 Tax=Helcococcus kunzii TaxID=40091 RepID=UPI0038AF4A56
MNRQEAIKQRILSELEKEDVMSDPRNNTMNFTSGIRLAKKIVSEVEVDQQPVSLADFLGWEEEVEYGAGIYEGGIHRVKDGRLEQSIGDGRWVNARLSLTPVKIKKLRNAQKVKTKKAYHVKDEYSLHELIKELKEQGALVDINLRDDFRKGYIYLFVDDENHINSYTHSRFLEDYDIIEYHKEEPKFYARYKGSINLYQDYNYYNYLAWKGVCVISDKGEVFDSIIQMTKPEWNELGINDTNADFEEVE